MFELTCSPNNYKMICAFVDVSLIDVSSGVMVYAVDPFIDFLSLVISQGRAKARVSLTSLMGAVVSMYGSNCCYQGENYLETVTKIYTSLAPPFADSFHFHFSPFLSLDCVCQEIDLINCEISPTLSFISCIPVHFLFCCLKRRHNFTSLSI